MSHTDPKFFRRQLFDRGTLLLAPQLTRQMRLSAMQDVH
jgi:hypothetical protein